jgi:Animal haem peroxidase
MQLRDVTGKILELDTDEGREDAVTGVRRTTLAARLKAVYGNVSKVDAFTGMVAEPHAAGSELGELQRAMWTKQFESLRDGDRFFYAIDPALPLIKALVGIDYRVTLAQVIQRNTAETVQANVFKAA